MIAFDSNGWIARTVLTTQFLRDAQHDVVCEGMIKDADSSRIPLKWFVRKRIDDESLQFSVLSFSMYLDEVGKMLVEERSDKGTGR